MDGAPAIVVIEAKEQPQILRLAYPSRSRATGPKRVPLIMAQDFYGAVCGTTDRALSNHKATANSSLRWLSLCEGRACGTQLTRVWLYAAGNCAARGDCADLESEEFS